MQTLIVFGFLNFAFANGEFADKMALHAKAVADTKTQVSHVGDAQVKFKNLMKSCEPKSIASQQALLSCGRQFLQLNLEFQSLKTSQAAAENTVASMPADFFPAAASLNKTLSESAKILSIVTDTPAKTSASLFALNSVYVQRQFERTGQEAFAKNSLRLYCRNLQAEIDNLTGIAQMALDSKMSFPTLYKQQIRIQNTIALAKEITPICHTSYKVDALKNVLVKLSSRTTPASYAQYKKSVCAKSSILPSKNCESLPLTSYTVSWLESVRGVK